MSEVPDDGAVLESVGISELEEAVYRSIIERPGRTVKQVAEATSLTQRDARGILRVLEQKGLVTFGPGTPQQFMPAPPDVALEALVLQRQEQLENVRAIASSFAERVRESVEIASPLEVIEVISGPTAMTQRVNQLQRQAQQEICILDRPPHVTSSNPLELELLASGIRYRTIYDQEMLSSELQLDWLDEYVDAGEEARVSLGVPAKLGLMDSKVALVPLYPAVSGGLVIHSSPLVDALVMLFEALWERAIPIGSPAGASADELQLSEREKSLLNMLAAGQKDEVIARRLGVTTRTVQRSLSDLMQQLGVSTRFQAGLQVTRRGWQQQS
ncbi:MAG: helix-turn-helix domain-containing protein [Actinomycetota bacterium]